MAQKRGIVYAHVAPRLRYSGPRTASCTGASTALMPPLGGLARGLLRHAAERVAMVRLGRLQRRDRDAGVEHVPHRFSRPARMSRAAENAGSS